MARIVFAIIFVVLGAARLSAADAARVQELSDVLKMTEIFEIIREEGIGYGDELAEDMFPDRIGPAWTNTVTAIYDIKDMGATTFRALEDRLSNEETTDIIAFFSGDLGRRIIQLENSARRALIDEAVEEASREHAAELPETDPERAELLDEFVAVNDLLESNVAGALNSNYAFYVGLNEGGAFPDPLPESDILSDIWSQEPDIRADTEEWLYAYLALAYQPLEDAELESYIAFSQTEAGRALNQALFDGFDTMFNDISRDLGFAAAGMLTGQDI